MKTKRRYTNVLKLTQICKESKVNGCPIIKKNENCEKLSESVNLG